MVKGSQKTYVAAAALSHSRCEVALVGQLVDGGIEVIDAAGHVKRLFGKGTNADYSSIAGRPTTVVVGRRPAVATFLAVVASCLS